MKRRGQKILSMALTVAMLFSMTGMNTALGTDASELYVGDTDILTAEGYTVACGEGRAVFDPATATLTLTNAEITAANRTDFGIFAEHLDGLSIVLEGENTIDGEDIHSGVYVFGELSLSGNGTLHITARPPSAEIAAYGLYCLEGVAIETATVEVTSAGATNAYGIDTPRGRCTITDATVEIDGCDVGINVPGNDITVGGSTILINNVVAGVNGGPEGDAALTFSDSSLTVTGQRASANADVAYALSGKNIILNNTSMTAEADPSLTIGNSVASHTDITVTNGSTLELQSGWPALRAETGITIEGSTVTAVSNNSNSVYTPGTLTISGDSDVSATGYYGLCGETGVTISGGKVNTVSTDDWGIFVPASAQITITGGTVEARGYWRAVGHVLDISGYSGDAVVTASGQSDGSAPVTYNPDNISAYKYLKIEPDGGETPTVTDVTVTPSAPNVPKGTTQQFTANVTGTNSPAQSVTWAVTGGGTGTGIDNGGLLTVAADETAASLTVTATSTVDTNQKGTAAVRVTDGAAHTWDGDGSSFTVADGDTITITSTASGTLAIPDGATVTITGTVTDSKPVQLNLGAGAKVNWAASYTGSRDNGALVQSDNTQINAAGTIEITGKIINNGTAGAWAIAVNSDVIVTSGTVTGQVSANNVTINAGSTVTSTSGMAIGADSIIINGGSTVTSTSYAAITASNDIIINGSRITGGSESTPAVAAITGSITLAGGTITANPGAMAVATDGKPITVTGKVAISGNVGTTDSQQPTTITINAGGTLTVPSGGTLTITNTGTIVNNGAIVNSGSIVNNGTITNHAGSTYTGANPTGSGTFAPPPSGGGGNGGGSGGGGGSSSGGDSTPTVTPSDPGKPDTATNAETKVTPTVNANGGATVTVPEKSITDAIKAAQEAAKKAGTEKNGISVTIDATTTKGASDITATLTEQSVDALIKAGVTEVRIKSDAATLSLDLATLKAAQAVAGGAVTVSAKPVAANTLSAAAREAIGDRPAFSFTLQSGGKPVTSFGGGSAAIAIPYTPQKGEDTGKLCVVYVDDKGGVTYLTGSGYDPNTKALIARTGHFSVFGVGYKADAPVFTDTANHWAKADIDFVAARGMLSGTGNNQFSPNTGMTRGMFVTALGRLAGVDTNSYKTGKFTDVKADAYYAPYVNWAAEKGIVSGTTATTFAPDSAVTRQEMAVIMANYAGALGYTVPKTREAATFADNTSIASWAKDAAKAMQMAGVVNGKDGNRFDPTGTATRAEVAAVLHRYVELVIDPATSAHQD